MPANNSFPVYSRNLPKSASLEADSNPLPFFSPKHNNEPIGRENMKRRAIIIFIVIASVIMLAGCKQEPEKKEFEFLFTLSEDTSHYIISGATGEKEITNPVLPSTYNSKAVTEVAENAFQNNYKMVGTLTIPSSITKIGSTAFYSCDYLSGSLTIPGTVKEIEYGAFQDCDGFEGNLTISEGVETIGSQAFYDIENFNGTLSIPSTVTSIGKSAFSDTFFKKITVADANTPYKSVDDVLMSKDGKTLIRAATGKSFENYSVPSGVTEITDSAFQEAKGLKGTLTIPKGVEKIGNSAFAGCNNLTGTL